MGRILRGLGKAGKVGAGPIAVGSAIALGVHGHYAGKDQVGPNKPGLFSSVKEGLFDFAMGDPYADWDMMGFPLTPVDVIPGLTLGTPEAAADFGRVIEAGKAAYRNPEYGGLQGMFQNMNYGDRLDRWYMNQAQANVGRGYTTIDDGSSSTLPYAPPYQKRGSYANQSFNNGVTATGDMVFGMYNLRQR